MKTQLLLPAILLSTISLAYAGGRTPPANGNSNSSKPTQAEVTGEPSKGGRFIDDGSEGIGGDPGTPEENSAVAALCASLQEGLDELDDAWAEACGKYYDLQCTEGPETNGDCSAAFAACQLAEAEMYEWIEAQTSADFDGDGESDCIAFGGGM